MIKYEINGYTTRFGSLPDDRFKIYVKTRGTLLRTYVEAT
ncbi:uncharacterized protein METZ01_LOCUS247378 [marine metagenome]|uniref:Uncharacterized protein n=1 Tax=marine metagenome TaxID=408172 RepID=A0A382I4B6_9ZZZZ